MKTENKFPDYDNCIVNLSCSIMKHFGVEPPNGTLPLADKWLEKRYKNVVVLLLDGMGVNILEEHLKPSGFFRKNLKGVYSSTFPPTTVAATTAMDSGLYPLQSAWLGWEGYFKEIDKNVVYFRNTDQYGDPAADFNVAWTYCPYQRIADRIKSTGTKAYYATPFYDPYLYNFDKICKRVKQLCEEEGEKYIYAYWTEPDQTMHEEGCHTRRIKSLLQEIESRTKELAQSLSDTLLIITADHGHINCDGVAITDYPDIMECLKRMPSIEARALNLFVKTGMSEKLQTAFQKHFGDKFLLLSKEEVLEKQLFGRGENHSRSEEMLGDFIAIGTDNLSIYNSVEEKNYFKAHHAGMTKAEMEIPLIAIQKYGKNF